jgi:hypothetical protein
LSCSDCVFVWHSASNTWVKQNINDGSFDPDFEYDIIQHTVHNVYHFVWIKPADFTTMLLKMSTEQLCFTLCHNCNNGTYDAIDKLSTPDLLQLQQAMLKRFEDPNTLLFNLTCRAIECLIDNVNYIHGKAFHKCQSTFWIKIPIWSRDASRWRDLLDDKPFPPESSDEEPNEDEQEEDEQEENEQEENDVQDHGDASSEMSLDSGVCTLFRVS